MAPCKELPWMKKWRRGHKVLCRGDYVILALFNSLPHQFLLTCCNLSKNRQYPNIGLQYPSLRFWGANYLSSHHSVSDVMKTLHTCISDISPVIANPRVSTRLNACFNDLRY